MGEEQTHRLKYNQRQRMDGLELLQGLPERFAHVVYLDPQREEDARNDVVLPSMSAPYGEWIEQAERVLVPNGSLILWLEGSSYEGGTYERWLPDSLEVVVRGTWRPQGFNPEESGKREEHVIVAHKMVPHSAHLYEHRLPLPYQWWRATPNTEGFWEKPYSLVGELIRPVTVPGDLVVDPAAGSYSTLAACLEEKRLFLGCDIAL